MAAILITKQDAELAKVLRKKGTPLRDLKFPNGFKDRGELTREKNQEVLNITFKG